MAPYQAVQLQLGSSRVSAKQETRYGSISLRDLNAYVIMQVHKTSGSDKQLIGGSFGSHWAIL